VAVFIRGPPRLVAFAVNGEKNFIKMLFIPRLGPPTP
jgi:hypothetical protein